MTKRIDEEYCRSAFDTFLRNTLESPQLSWEDVKQDPPDYFLHISGVKYAVEVTIISEKMLLATDEVELVAIYIPLQRFVREVERSANENGYLKGNYSIYFLRPIVGFSKIRKQLKRDLLTFIKSTQEQENTQKEKILYHEDTICEIRKIKSSPTRIDPWLPIRIDEGQSGLTKILDKRISEKERLLRHIPCQKILLLCDLYTTANVDMYRNCKNQLKALKAFNTIFVVQNRKTGFILHSIHRELARYYQ